MVKIDFDKVMIVFGMGDGLRTNKDLLSSEQLTLYHMYQQLEPSEKESVKNEYQKLIAHLIATN